MLGCRLARIRCFHSMSVARMPRSNALARSAPRYAGNTHAKATNDNSFGEVTRDDLAPFELRKSFVDSESSDDLLTMGTETHREREVFANLLSTMFEQQSNEVKPKPPSSSKSSSSKTTLQSKLYDTFSYGMPSKDGQVELVEGDTRKLPVNALESGQQAARIESDRVKEIILPVLEHIDSLESDLDVAAYFQQKILDRSADLEKSEAEQHVLDEHAPIDVHNPPITKDTVSHYLSKVISVLDMFGSPMQAFTVFELSKRTGYQFYLSACNETVYNQVLRLRWKYHRDLSTLESLVSEMHTNAISGDRETAEIIAQIVRERNATRYGGDSRFLLAVTSDEDQRIMNKLYSYHLKILRDSLQQKLNL
uniref:ARAD1C02046p n=1 Tax=Blastobotrys adeninivorans TaxID=409370 RepID=A0A060T500_BLAAD